MSLGREILSDYAYELDFKREKPMFTRGYSECRKRLANSPRYSMSCFNCRFYYQASGDKEEVCQNSNVIAYDMVVSGNNIYCLKWEMLKNKETFSEKIGRNKLDDYKKETVSETGKVSRKRYERTNHRSKRGTVGHER